MESVDREEEFDHKMHQVESPDSLGSDQGFEKLESASPVSAPDDTALYGYEAPGSQFDKKDEDESEQEMEANREADISEKNIVMSPFEHASGEQDHEHTPDSGAEDVDKFGHEDAERVEEEFGDDDLDEGERDKPEKGLLVDFDEPQSTKPYETDLYTSPSDTMQQLQEAILEPEEREPEQEEPTPQLSAPEIPTDPLEAEMSHEVPEVSAASAVDSELAATDTLQAGAEQESTGEHSTSTTIAAEATSPLPALHGDTNVTPELVQPSKSPVDIAREEFLQLLDEDERAALESTEEKAQRVEGEEDSAAHKEWSPDTGSSFEVVDDMTDSREECREVLSTDDTHLHKMEASGQLSDLNLTDERHGGEAGIEFAKEILPKTVWEGMGSNEAVPETDQEVVLTGPVQPQLYEGVPSEESHLDHAIEGGVHAGWGESLPALHGESQGITGREQSFAAGASAPIYDPESQVVPDAGCFPEPSVTPLCEVSESTPAPYEFSPRSEMPGEALVAEEAEEAIESVKKEEEEEKEAHDVPALKVDAPADEVTSSSSKEKCCIFNVENWDPRFVDLVYWRDLKKSGVCFSSTLLVLLMVSYFSLMLVLTYASIALLTVTISFYVYKKAVQAVQKSSEGHPFKEFLDKDVTVPADRAKCVADLVVAHVNPILTDLRRIFLVEHLVDTVKFGAVLWVMTYICYWFDGYVLMIMGWVTLFTIPKIYEAHKEKIDCYLEKAQEKAKEIVSKVKERIPIGKKEKSQ